MNRIDGIGIGGGVGGANTGEPGAKARGNLSALQLNLHHSCAILGKPDRDDDGRSGATGRA